MTDSILATLWRWCTHFCYNKLNNGCFGILIFNIIQLTERLLKCHLPCLRIQRKRLLFRKYHDQTYLTFLDSQNSIYEHEAKIVNTYVLQELSLTISFHITVTLSPVFLAIDEKDILQQSGKNANLPCTFPSSPCPATCPLATYIWFGWMAILKWY